MADNVEDSLLATVHKLSDKVRSENSGNWHFSISAPRWALRSSKFGALDSVIAFLVAIGLAVGGVILAWHASDELTKSKTGLAVQIGPWVVVAVLLIAAGAAAIAAFGSQRLHLRITELTDGDAAATALAASASESGLLKGGTAGANGPVDSTGAVTTHAREAARLAQKATDAANQATPDVAAAANSAAASAHAAAATAAQVAAADGASGAAGSSPSDQNAATTISPKVWAGTIAGAVSFSFWTIATATFWKNTFSSDALAALVGSTTAIVASAAAYFKADPLRSKL